MFPIDDCNPVARIVTKAAMNTVGLGAAHEILH
jgi:hypothetical protein